MGEVVSLKSTQNLNFKSEGSNPARSAFESLCQQSEVWNIQALLSTDDGFLYRVSKPPSHSRPNPTGASPNAKALAFNSLVCCKKRISSSKPALSTGGSCDTIISWLCSEDITHHNGDMSLGYRTG